MQELLYLISVKLPNVELCGIFLTLAFFHCGNLEIFLFKQSSMHDSVTKVLFVDEIMV